MLNQLLVLIPQGLLGDTWSLKPWAPEPPTSFYFYFADSTQSHFDKEVSVKHGHMETFQEEQTSNNQRWS